MKKLTSWQLIWSLSLLFTHLLPNSNLHAASPNIYEAMTGTNGNSMNSVAGSSDSIGFTGNWRKVDGIKSGNDPALASVFTTSYNSYLAFPANSKFTIPAGNSAAGTASNFWHAYQSARELSSPLSFDSNGTYYFSFLMYVPSDSWGNTGSAVVGFLNGLPVGNSDTSKSALYFGRTYSSKLAIKLKSANVPVWEGASTSAEGASTISGSSGSKSWFVLGKITSESSGNDVVRLKAYSSTDNLPTTDSSITWDVTLSTPITGSWGYLAVQGEYNAIIDEFRGGLSYNSVAGTASAATISAPVASGTLKKGTSSSISVDVDAPGYVRFLVDGKRISGCLKVPTTGTSPTFTATCNWKPSVKGAKVLTASYIPSDPLYLAANSSPSVHLVSQRTGSR